MTDFVGWKAFSYDESSVQLWVFKKSTSTKKFNAWHVQTDDTLEQLFRDAIKSEAARITESISYSALSQNNESSCLSHSLEQSEGLIALLDMVDAIESENRDAELKHLKGAAGYLVKFQFNNQCVYAVRKTAPTWKPKIRNSFINAIFNNGELSATPEETFCFDAYFDFYCLNETIFVSSKRTYESMVSDKKVYKKTFDDLTINPQFAAIFNSMTPLKDYVGQNAMQLRRMTAIQQKAIFLTSGFVPRLQSVSQMRGWGINFDDNGKIVICKDTVKNVLQVLLDHRLLSEITDTIYDVPDAEAIRA